MDFSLSDAQRQMQDAVRRFAQQELAPRTADSKAYHQRLAGDS